MSTDINKLNAADLKKLASKIEKRIVEVEKESLHLALKEMRAVADKLGVTFDDVIELHKGKGRKPSTKAAAKYANPDDPSQTWTGRGRKPAWVNAALEAGKSIDDLAI